VKARIELEISDDSLTEEEKKSLLIEELYCLCYDWVNGIDIPFIKIVHSEDNPPEDIFVWASQNKHKDLPN
jgi:hypothetical protein